MQRTRRGSPGQFELGLTAARAVPAARAVIETVPDAAVLRAWLVEWLAALPETLTRRGTVLVPGAELAHALRCHVAAGLGRPGLLHGVTFIRPQELAADLLARAGRPAVRHREPIRWLLLRDLFDRGDLAGRLRYFECDELRSGPGYVDAFARAIADLEEAGLAPADLERIADSISAENALDARRLTDVAAVWAEIMRATPGHHLSRPALYLAAAALLGRHSGIGPAIGPIAAVVPHVPPTALMRFLSMLEPARIVTFEARPEERSDRNRWPGAPEMRPARTEVARTEVARTGGVVDRGDGLVAPVAPAALSGGDLLRLQARLFAGSDPGEPPLAGPIDDGGRVERVMFASVADEVDAAAAWVIGEIARGTAAGAIAILVPDVATYAPLIADRLARLDPPGRAPVPVRVPEGLTADLSPAGLRLRALFVALESGLEAEATLPLLPWFRDPALAPDADAEDATLAPAPAPSELALLVYSAGIVGGREANGDEWQNGLRVLRSVLDREIASDAGSGEAGGRAAMHSRLRAERMIERIDRLLPGVAALEAVQARVRSAAPLPELWVAIRDFTRQWLRLPPEPRNLPAIFDEHLAPILEHRAALRLAGLPGLRFLAGRLRSLLLGVGRRGEPAVFVGTPPALAGFTFTAVRILGLVEGIVPGSPEKDPILPDDLRVLVESRMRAGGAGDVVVPRGEDRALADRQALSLIVRATERSLSLSAPRQWFDKSEREVSGIMLEVEMALDPRGDVPTLADVRARLASGPGAPSAEAAAVLPAQNLVAARARGAGGSVPGAWLGTAESPIDLARLLALETEKASPDRVGPADGSVGSVLPPGAVPGLAAERPISASALGTFLACPHRFLQMRLLHREEPPRRPPTDAIESLAFGSLLHTIAEIFFREHGAALCRQEQSEVEWQRRMQRIAEQEFERFRNRYPLRGRNVIERERKRVLRTAAEIIAYEWKQGRRDYVAVEHAFGDLAGVAVGTPAASLFVNGRIDRIDRLETGGLEVRDLKTGRAHHLGEEDLNPRNDLQVGLYSLALAATMPGEPVIAAAYVYAEAPRDPERRFMGEDLARLRLNTGRWLATARALLAAGAFVRTPEKDDCTFCRFKPYCGDDAYDDAAAKLGRATSAELIEFRDFKREARP